MAPVAFGENLQDPEIAALSWYELDGSIGEHWRVNIGRFHLGSGDFLK